MHCSQTKEHFEHSLDVVCDTIHLNAIVSKFTVAFERYDTTKVCARLLARELAEFQDCRQLCDLLFPQSGPPVFLTRESLRPVRRHQALKERLEHFATKAWKSVPQERRWCNADAFILLSEVLRVISAPNKVGVLLSVEEKAFQKKNVSSDGMTQDKERGGVFSFFRLLEHGRKLLYVYGDVLNSAHFTVRRFLSLPAWRRSVTLPALSNVARLLELHLTSCLALFARLFVDYEDPVCLPENYMATVKFSDGNDCAKFTLSTAVDATARGLPPYKGIRQVQKLLEYMVRLLCGKIGHHFSVIPSAFTAGSLKHVMSGEAERFLVLALTMLCNCGRGIPNSCAPVLLDCLRGVSVHELLPRRVQVALHSIEEVYNTHDAVLLLKGLLDQRKEKLFKLHWKNRSLLLDEHFDFASFQQSLHSGPAFTRPGSTGAAAAPVDPIEFDLSSEFQMPAGYAEELVREHALAEEEAERELAAVKIQRWFRHNLLHRECDKRGTAEDQQTALPRFDQFKVDDSACGICGIHFAKKLEADGTHGEGARIHTRDTHLAPDSPHWQMAEEFHKYKRIYVERVHPLNVTAAEVMRNLDAPAWAPMRTQSSHDFGLDLQRLGNARARVGEFVRHIESRCNWGGLTAGLEQAIVAFASTVKEVQRLLIEGKVGMLGENSSLRLESSLNAIQSPYLSVSILSFWLNLTARCCDF